MTCASLSIGIVQCALDGTREENVARVEALVREAAKEGAQVVLTPELFEGPYFPQTEDERAFDLAAPLDGHPSVARMRALAAELEIVLPVSFFERSGQSYYNSLVAIDADGTVLGIYRKSHIPDGPGYEEKFYFRPGDTGFQVWKTRHGRIGVGICWDQWFPEAARLTALSGAQIIFYPTAIGFQDFDAEEAAKQHQAWETIQKSHAIANGVFVAAVNRVGKENAVEFWGQSFVCDPFGEILVRGSRDSEEILIVECDLSLIEQTRQGWPFLRDRRTDAYKGLNRLFIDPS